MYPWRIGGLNTGQLFIDFANSEWYDGRGNVADRLQDPTWRRAFLRECGLKRYEPLEEADLPELIEVRSAIRSIAERVRASRAPARRDLELLKAVLTDHPMRFQLSRRGAQLELEMVPVEQPPKGLAGEIALSAARFLAGGQLDRLKMCDNPGCRWMFLDRTKNRTRRWCGPCGNIDKVRRFRERHRMGP